MGIKLRRTSEYGTQARQAVIVAKQRGKVRLRMGKHSAATACFSCRIRGPHSIYTLPYFRPLFAGSLPNSTPCAVPKESCTRTLIRQRRCAFAQTVYRKLRALVNKGRAATWGHDRMEGKITGSLLLRRLTALSMMILTNVRNDVLQNVLSEKSCMPVDVMSAYVRLRVYSREGDGRVYLPASS